MPTDDDLARTATAPSPAGGVDKPSAPRIEVGAMVGRYRLERELGSGGMGVVYAAFDPDLERRIALKVLHTEAGEARKRLLREARAMARLFHPNVVVVYEVGSASGRDYVAMELVDGGSLAEWVRSERRDPAAVLAAFVSAGRGLAAAHAAGLVHRDFKPHNVLRSRDGRVLVTDFGLARELTVGGAVALDTTLPLGTTQASMTESGRPLDRTLTKTGSVLGTPAYMAPEQWSGGSVGPAADQFAFCVAMWEALVGERPYRGDSAEQLREQVLRGPTALDLAKLPRAVREPLRRGLSPDPVKRFPSVTALLDRIQPRRRDKYVTAFFASLIGIVAVVGAVVGYAELSRHGGGTGVGAADDADGLVGGGDACASSPLPADAWSSAAATELVTAGRGDLAGPLQREADNWRAEHEVACAVHGPQRARRLACLRAVALRFGAVRRAVDQLAGGATTADDVLAELVDPQACSSDAPPLLTAGGTPDVVTALRSQLRAKQRGGVAEADQVAASLAASPCAHAIALLAVDDAAITVNDVGHARDASIAAGQAANACGDDWLRAEAAIAEAAATTSGADVLSRAGARDAVTHAHDAVARTRDAGQRAELASLDATLAHAGARWGDALAALDRAVVDFGARGRTRSQLRAVLGALDVRLSRQAPGDLDDARKLVARWRNVAAPYDDIAPQLDRFDGEALLYQGDVIDAHPLLERTWRQDPWGPSGAIDATGTVVDKAGKPVVGATVAAAETVTADSLGVVPIDPLAATLELTTSGGGGAFELVHAPKTGAVVAQLGDLRSAPVAVSDLGVKLVLQPTRRIGGTVTVRGAPPTGAVALVTTADDPRYELIAPIAGNGTFHVDGAPIVALRVTLGARGGLPAGTAFATVAAGTSAVTDVTLVVEP
jgi:predicted Ser/Thr protein kinase|nr:serine/threonine-protein kinase [Kofleriaceae bacterium]